MNIVTALFPLLALFGADGDPNFSVRLHAAHDTLAPGTQTTLAIEINVEKDWHIYHPIIIDTGAPTTIDFDVPTDVTVGLPLFPFPDLDEEYDLEYFSHHGRIIVLTDLELAPDSTLESIPIAVTVSALACKELCVPVTAQARLTIPVAASPKPAADQKSLKQARENLPKPLPTADYLAGSTLRISTDQITVDQEAELLLTLNIQSHHHVQAPNPGVEGLIGARLFIEPRAGLELGEPQWPEPQRRAIPNFGTAREYAGDVTVRVPIIITDPLFPRGPVTLRTLFMYQVCSDAGTCFPPTYAAGQVSFNADTPNEPTPADTEPGQSLDSASTASTSDTTSQSPTAKLLWNLVLGFIGGLLLNIMPCVFPVISLKIISFVKQAGEDRGRIFRLGLVFCAGIMVWFWIFAWITSIGQIPWQHPPVVISLVAILFLFALNLFGVFEITLPGQASTHLEQAAAREGYPGAFIKGFLATLLGTACTAPFFASAAAYASTQGLLISFVVFTGAGLGMSSPYVILSAFPRWLSALPKPGPWMVIFKQAMGFVLAGTAVWLLLTVADLLDARGVVWTVALLGFVALAAWLIGRINLAWSFRARLITWLAALATVAIGIWFCFFLMYDINAANSSGHAAHTTRADLIATVASDDWSDHIPWQPFTPGLPEQLANDGYTVYVDFTATWCVTCQTNKATAVDIASTRALMRDLGVIPLKADYTRTDPEIRKILLAFEHNSVPLNLVYPANHPENVIKLPVVLTPGIVSDALTKAGPSKTTPDPFPAAQPASDSAPHPL